MPLSTSRSPLGLTLTLYQASGLGAGPPVTLPSWSKREPWHGQANPVSDTPTMQPRWVQVVEMAAIFAPSRTTQTRRKSSAIRVPEGYSSGLPIANRAGDPYVARGLMKTRFEKALKTADP